MAVKKSLGKIKISLDQATQTRYKPLPMKEFFEVLAIGALLFVCAVLLMGAF